MHLVTREGKEAPVGFREEEKRLTDKMRKGEKRVITSGSRHEKVSRQWGYKMREENIREEKGQ